MEFELVDIKNIEGTSFQGDLFINYEKLIEVFGKPNGGPSGDNKIYCEWIIYFPEEKIYSSIYNWKNGPNYPKGGPTENIIHWSIGGKDNKSVLIIYEYLKEKLGKYSCNLNTKFSNNIIIDCKSEVKKQ